MSAVHERERDERAERIERWRFHTSCSFVTST
jgi:hypothetical protein